MNFTISLMGTAPLLQHSPRLADPSDDLVREMKAITAKRKKTEADLEALARLEWFGGLYTSNGEGPKRIVMPTASIRKCLIEAGKVTKSGKAIGRAVTFRSMHAPLQYDGPQDIDELFKNKRFHSRLLVRVSSQRVMRVRPQFPQPWTLEASGVFIQDAGLNWDEFERICELAGQIEGIGDNRANGYGRFEATLTKEGD